MRTAIRVSAFCLALVLVVETVEAGQFPVQLPKFRMDDWIYCYAVDTKQTTFVISDLFVGDSLYSDKLDSTFHRAVNSGFLMHDFDRNKVNCEFSTTSEAEGRAERSEMIKKASDIWEMKVEEWGWKCSRLCFENLPPGR